MATHLQNRVDMAMRLADFIDTHLPADTDLAVLEIFTEAEWTEITRLAGEQHVPSPATRACVIGILRERRSDEDPFRGFS